MRLATLGSSSARACWAVPCACSALLFASCALLCVIVPLCTENWLRFSARLDNEVTMVRFERVAS